MLRQFRDFWVKGSGLYSLSERQGIALAGNADDLHRIGECIPIAIEGTFDDAQRTVKSFLQTSNFGQVLICQPLIQST